MSSEKVKDLSTVADIHQLIEECGADPSSFDAALVTELMQTSLRLLFDGHDTGQIKLMNRALKEMRYAYSIFNQFTGIRRISIFGSARTPEDHPDYQMAKALSAALASRGWMAITGAAQGIMKAGLEGASRSSSFGLSIRLPNEEGANNIIAGDIKLINFHYFFTRKLMFMSQSDAVAVFPGGFGTLDELFECLTLMQTGKATIIPVVLLEGLGETYWPNWVDYIEKNLLRTGWISAIDRNLYYVAPSVDDAVAHITRFYKRFHSYRYVKDTMVIRLRQSLSPQQVAELNEEFRSLIAVGAMQQREAFEEEDEFRDLPRLCFEHTHRDYGRFRLLIDRINQTPL